MQYATEGGGLKSKAFTLIELLAVIVILGVIALIVSPIVLGTIRKSEKASFARSIDGIIESVRIDHSDDEFLAPREYYYERDDLLLLTVNENKRDELVNINGRIDGNGFVHVDGEGNITIDKICNKKYCASGTEDNIIITENETGELTEFDRSEPIITLNGNRIIYVELNGIYKELGATARTITGDKLEYTTEIKEKGTVVESIDTSKEGEYIITYRTSNGGNIATVTRTVAVLVMTPEITMSEGNPNYVKSQEVLIHVSAIQPNTVSNFTVEIKKDGETSSKETITGTSKELSLNETGNYEVIVTVTDNNGHTNTISRTYKIDTEPPVITVPESTIVKITEAATYDVMTNVVVSDNSGVTPTVISSGGLSATLGDQTITYTATDQAGNTKSVTRTFTVVEADGPILNFSNVGSSSWTKAQNIIVTATDNSNLSSFTYEVIKDGTSQGVKTVSVSGKSASTTVSLSATGTYSIKLTGKDEYGNSSSASSNSYKIDVTAPTYTVTGNPTSWAKSATLTIANAADSNSGLHATAYSFDGGSTWSATATKTVTANGTYNVVVRDAVGNTKATSVSVTKIDTTGPTISNVIVGSMLYTDPTFASGTNSTNTYNNSGNGTVTVVREAMTTPTGSGYGLKISNTGTASPGLGGFSFKTPSAANKVFVTRILAKIPQGYSIAWNSNSTGTGGTKTWLTDTAGTGDWKEYIIQVNCGSEGTFSTTNYFYLTGTVGTTSNPVVWYVGYATTIDTTAWGSKNYITFTATDNAGVTGYGINQSSTTAPTYTSVTSTTKLVTMQTSGVSANGTYYIWAKDSLGNTNKQSVTVSKIDKTAPSIANVKATGYIGGNTVTATLSDNNGLAGYTLTTTAANSCSGTAPTTWTTISGTSYNLSAKYTGYGQTYLWVKDSAGNTTCTSKDIFKVVYSTKADTSCTVDDYSVTDTNGKIALSLATTCSSTSDNFGQLWIFVYPIVMNDTKVTYTFDSNTARSSYQAVYYNSSNSSSGASSWTNSASSTITSYIDGWFALFNGRSGTNTVSVNISKIVYNDTTVVYNGGFVTY